MRTVGIPGTIEVGSGQPPHLSLPHSPTPSNACGQRNRKSQPVFKLSHATETGAQFLQKLEALFNSSKGKGSIWLNHKRRAVDQP